MPRKQTTKVKQLKHRSMSVSTSYHNSGIRELVEKMRYLALNITIKNDFVLDEEVADLFELLDDLNQELKPYYGTEL